MKLHSILVKVPATVGNFAGAMNCAALTVDATMNVKVTPRTDGRVGIRYFGEGGNSIPRDRSNLAVRAMEAALHLRGLEFTGADFEVYSSVPVGVGLGSSTAAVLAGLIAADRLYSLRLNEKTIFDLARIYESRMDNLKAAWQGGFVVSMGAQLSSEIRRTFVPGDFILSVVTPESEERLATTVVQRPEESDGQAQACNLDRARKLADLFGRLGNNTAFGPQASLPPFSRKVVPGLEEVLGLQLEGSMGVFVCGSGPALGILTKGNPGELIGVIRHHFLRYGVKSTYGVFRPTNVGARELNAVIPKSVFPSLRTVETLNSRPVS